MVKQLKWNSLQLRDTSRMFNSNFAAKDGASLLGHYVEEESH